MELKTYAADSNGYRFGFNGMEKDDEIFKGAYSAEYWEYDSRIGRRWNVDPLTAKYPWQSPYACFNNNPLQFSDPNGLEGQSDPPKQHTVKKDETLGGIAAANNVSVDDLLAWNKGNIAVKSANVVWAGYNINISDPNPTSDVSINVIDDEMKDRINFKPDVYFKGKGEKGNQFGYMTEIPGNQTGKEEYLERYFEFITGDGWTNMVYGPSSQMTQGVSQMESIDKARQYFYTKYAGNNGNFSSSNSVTNYRGTWTTSDVVATGSGNMSAQYVGSCSINVFVSADCKNLIFVVANSTSQWSYSYHLLPKSWNPERPSDFTAYDSKEKISYSTIYNLYIWKEPITATSSGSCTQNNSGGGCILR